MGCHSLLLIKPAAADPTRSVISEEGVQQSPIVLLEPSSRTAGNLLSFAHPQVAKSSQGPEEQAHRKTLTDFPESSSSGPLPPFPASSPVLPVSSTTSAAQVAQLRGLRAGGFGVAREDRTFAGARPGFALTSHSFSAPGSCDRRGAVLACPVQPRSLSSRLKPRENNHKRNPETLLGVFTLNRSFESRPDTSRPRLGGSSAGGVRRGVAGAGIPGRARKTGPGPRCCARGTAPLEARPVGE